MVNLVTIANTKYHVDIGFGGGGPPFPLPLSDPNPETNTRFTASPQLSFPCLPTQSSSTSSNAPNPARSKHTTIRLIHRTLRDEPSATRPSDPAQALWVYEMRVAGSEEWTPRYAFTETEFLPSDFEVMNHYTSTSSKIWFTKKIVCVRYLLDGDDGDLAKLEEGEEDKGKEDEEGVEKGIVGQIMLDGNVVKRRIGEESEVLEELRSEEERVRALERWFGIVLSQEEREGIRGMVTELKG
jgi:arylamine N-acetyltransferase